MADKPKIAFYWCASCGGCEESIVDLAEDILTVAGLADIVFWPVALDIKKKDVEAMGDGSILFTLINGGIRTSEQEEMARLLRRKSRWIVAHGACAQLGGVPALANQFDREQILKYVYDDAPSVDNKDKTRPLPELKTDQGTVMLPRFYGGVRSLDQVIEVDFVIPGCAPTPGILKQAVLTLVGGDVPPKGSVLAPDVALCDSCPRRDTKPVDLSIQAIRRPHTKMMEPDKCFLAQEVVCMGPSTRGGCEALCVKGNMPCTGCFGPTSRVSDQGAKMISSLCSSVASNDAVEIETILQGVPDPVGTFYRYGLAKSLLRKKFKKS